MAGAKGLHQDIFTAAAYCVEEGWDDQTIYNFLREGCDSVTDRRVPDREIFGAISYARMKAAGQISLVSHRWPERNNTLRAETCRMFPVDLEFLKRGVLYEPALYFLRILYRPTDLICIGQTSFNFRTLAMGEIPDTVKDLDECEFINPSPMIARAGLTVSDNYSSHAKANTGPRVYAVVEFDDGHPREHVAILRFLSHKLPLTMMVYSGKTSIHGWFKCNHVTEDEVVQFYAMAIELGADPKMFSPTQFSRLPSGRNPKTARRQQVFMLNPRHVYHS